MKKIYFVLLTSLLYNLHFVYCDLSLGDECVARLRQPGTCTKISACEPIKKNLRKGIQNHVVCYESGSSQIVCCPNPDAESSTTTTVKPLRVSVRKCAEYQKIWVSTCAPIALIVNGIEAAIGEFPHMALIGYKKRPIPWGCGGTLISEQFVLSAAHCNALRHPGRLYPAKYVRLGAHSRSNTSDGEIQLEIIDTFTHPQYYYGLHYYDIALFKLERQVTFSTVIRPACLPEQANAHTNRVTAAGWGATKFKGVVSNVLLKVYLELFTQDECNEALATLPDLHLSMGIVGETQVCAGSKTERSDTCQGDSGGPLTVEHPTQECTYTVVGVTSFGKKCGNIGTPGVYTRVYAFLDWIESIVWPYQ